MVLHVNEDDLAMKDTNLDRCFDFITEIIHRMQSQRNKVLAHNPPQTAHFLRPPSADGELNIPPGCAICHSSTFN